MPQLRHRALADVGVQQLQRGGSIDFAVEAQRRLHFADLLAGQRAQFLRLLGVFVEAGTAQLHDDAVEHWVERSHRRVEVAQVARVFGQQESALGGLGVEHQAQVARHECLTLLGRGDSCAGLVNALVARFRDDEQRRNERGPEQDRGVVRGSW